MTELEEERRDALVKLDDETRQIVLKHQHDIPFLKLLAIEAAK